MARARLIASHRSRRCVLTPARSVLPGMLFLYRLSLKPALHRCHPGAAIFDNSCYTYIWTGMVFSVSFRAVRLIDELPERAA